jgi:HK97 family phage portal protein
VSLFARERRELSLDQVMRSAGYAPRGSGSTPVTPDSAMRQSTWWGCVHLLASVVSGLPVDAFLHRPDGSRQELAPVPTIVGAPSALVSTGTWRYQMVVSMLQRGNAVGVVTARDRRMYPLGVELLHPDTVRIEQKHQLEPARFFVGREEIPREDVFHVPAFVQPGSQVGLSPISYARHTMAAAMEANRYAEEFWAGGGHPTAVLSTDQTLDPDGAARIKARFKEATKDDKLAVLGAGLSYSAVQVSPDDAGWLDSINATDIMICRFAGVPPEMMGVAMSGSSVTYANREQRAIDFLTFTVQWWLTRIEEAWSALLPRNSYVKHNAAALLRTDVKTRAEVSAIRLQNGMTNVDFERALDDLPPVPDGAGQVYKQPSAGGPVAQEGTNGT